MDDGLKVILTLSAFLFGMGYFCAQFVGWATEDIPLTLERKLEECELNLTRDQHCILVAVPAKAEVANVESN